MSPPEGEDSVKCFPARSLAQELSEVNEAHVVWQEACFVQFLSVSANDAHAVIKVAPHIPLLVGAGVRRKRTTVSPTGRVEDDSAGCPPSGVEDLNNKIWQFVAKTFDAPTVKTPLERPSEGAIVRSLPNKNVSLPGANHKPANLKFGSHGGLSILDVDIGLLAISRDTSDDEEDE